MCSGGKSGGSEVYDCQARVHESGTGDETTQYRDSPGDTKTGIIRTAKVTPDEVNYSTTDGLLDNLSETVAGKQQILLAVEKSLPEHRGIEDLPLDLSLLKSNSTVENVCHTREQSNRSCDDNQSQVQCAENVGVVL